MPLAYYNPNKSSIDDVIVFVNNSHGQANKIHGGENISNINDLAQYNLDENQTWTFVYPDEGKVRTGQSLDPPISRVTRMISGVAKSKDGLMGEKVGNDENQIKIYVKDAINEKMFL